MERRYFEIRAEEGRIIEGVALRFNDVAEMPWGRERIERQAFGDVATADVVLNVQHDRARPVARTLGGGLMLASADDALRFKAVLPETREATDLLELVRSRVLRGASVEFTVSAERLEGDLRVVQSASLRGLAIVDTPAYPQSEIAARQKHLAPPAARRRRIVL